MTDRTSADIEAERQTLPYERFSILSPLDKQTECKMRSLEHAANALGQFVWHRMWLCSKCGTKWPNWTASRFPFW